jgi:hypothetical protein
MATLTNKTLAENENAQPPSVREWRWRNWEWGEEGNWKKTRRVETNEIGGLRIVLDGFGVVCRNWSCSQEGDQLHLESGIREHQTCGLVDFAP